MSIKNIKNYIIMLIICMILILLSSKMDWLNQYKDEVNTMEKKNEVEGTKEIKHIEGLIFANQYMEDINNIQVIKDLEEEMGIDVTFDKVSSSKNLSQRKYILQKAQQPDFIMGGNLKNSDIHAYIHNKRVIPLDDLIEKYAPHIRKIFEEQPTLKKYCTFLDGQIYTLPFVNEMEYEEVENYLFINKTWLDKLGLDMPTTTEEFYKVLKAFKKMDPNGNGKDDEIPFSYIDEIEEYNINSFMGAFGVINNENDLMMKDEKVSFVPIGQAYKEFILYLRRLYEEHLLDTEIFTQDLEQYIRKGHQKEAILGAFIAEDSTIIVGEDRGNNDYVVVPPLKGPHGDQLWGRKKSTITPNQFMITTDNKNPIETIKWVDQFYDPEKALSILWGAEGVTIKKSNGLYKFIGPPIGKSYLTFSMENSLRGACPGIYTKEMAESFIYNPIEIRKKENYNIYKPYLVEEHMCIFSDSVIDYTEIEDLYNNINEYIKQIKIMWISGERSIESGWENYQNVLKSMDIERYIELYQKVHDSCPVKKYHYPPK